jgi:hypothetical protein
MTAADIPTTSGVPNNGGEGYPFLGLPAFDGLVGWDFTHPNQIAGLTPGLATGIAGHRAGIGELLCADQSPGRSRAGAD